MTAFKTYRNKLTGQVSSLPANYEKLFPDTLEEVDPSNLRCVDCGVPEPEVEETVEEDAPVLLTEPEPIAWDYDNR